MSSRGKKMLEMVVPKENGDHKSEISVANRVLKTSRTNSLQTETSCSDLSVPQDISISGLEPVSWYSDNLGINEDLVPRSSTQLNVIDTLDFVETNQTSNENCSGYVAVTDVISENLNVNEYIVVTDLICDSLATENDTVQVIDVPVSDSWPIPNNVNDRTAETENDLTANNNLNNENCSTDLINLSYNDTVDKPNIHDLNYSCLSESDEDTVQPVKDLRQVNPFDNQENENIGEKEGNLSGPDGKRKRKRKGFGDSNTWMRNKQMKARRLGENYLGVQKNNESGKYQQNILKNARKMGPPCKCSRSSKSKKFSCSAFEEEDRSKIFNSFWKNMDWGQRKVFIASLVDCTVPGTRRKDTEESRKGNSFQYHLKKNDERFRVCKTMFLSTLNIGEFSIRDWVLQSTNGLPNKPYETPKSSNKKNQEAEKRKQYLKDFLLNLPFMESHYCRADTSKLYLEPVWDSKQQIFNEYKKKSANDNMENLQWSTFCRVFSTLNLSLYAPKKDQCDMCSAYKLGSLSLEHYKQHQMNKELARAEKTADTQTAKSNSFLRCYTMDMQKVLLAPRLQTSASYYKTKLKVHNLTVHNQSTQDVVCFLWNETEGGLVGDVFASILSNFIKKECQSNVIKTITVFSDGCTYQNRNVTMANALLNTAVTQNITIIQKFLEKGHTQMEVDACHSLIERKLGNKTINVPADYVEICKNARKNPTPFKVEVLSHKDFSNFSSKLYYSSIRPGNRTGDPVVTDIKALLYNPSGSISYKLQFSDNWNLLPRRAKKNTLTLPFSPEVLYPSRLKITLEKFKHLQDLKWHVLEDYRLFYDFLPHDCMEGDKCPHKKKSV